MKSLSVIVCTYNPIEKVFKKCLEHIEKASRGYNPLEILIVDNNSTVAVSDRDYIAHFSKLLPQMRVIVELKQGLTPARIRGLKEAKGEVVVFIDDDNFIEEFFFKKGIEVCEKNPHIGAWSGQVELVFETQPENWTRKYWGLLVYRKFEKDVWSNFPHMAETMPCGAGLFILRNVADHYIALHDKGKRNIQLDRSSNSLLSGGDNDLAACACDIGLGVGLFHEIKLDHYIPAKRLTKEYLVKLAEGIAASAVIFKSFRNEQPQSRSFKNRVASSLRSILKNKVDREFYKAVLRGEKMGAEIVKTNRENY